MFAVFVIVLREGFEAFLIVSVIAAYLNRTNQVWLLPSVYRGIAASVFVSTALALVLSNGANGPLWEGVLGLVAAVFVTTLVIQMWKEGRVMKKNIEKRVGDITTGGSKELAHWGIFFFTLLMIAREGMETVLLVIQVPQKEVLAGTVLGLAVVGVFALIWVKVSHLINLKLFFQVTGIFLLLFVVQILIYSAHELSEAGIFPNSEAFHAATEPYGPEGMYGKWYPLVILLVCTAWLAFGWIRNRLGTAEKAGK